MEDKVFAEVDRFVGETIVAEDEALRGVAEAAEAAGLPSIQVSPPQGKLLGLLVRLLDAKQVLEFGTLGGSSAILTARALPQDGGLITLEGRPRCTGGARQTTRRGAGGGGV